MTETVSVMRFGGKTPEELLREALSECAEIRSRGEEPYILVMLGEGDSMPQLGFTSLRSTILLACAMRIHIEAEDHVREIYDK